MIDGYYSVFNLCLIPVGLSLFLHRVTLELISVSLMLTHLFTEIWDVCVHVRVCEFIFSNGSLIPL